MTCVTCGVGLLVFEVAFSVTVSCRAGGASCSRMPDCTDCLSLVAPTLDVEETSSMPGIEALTLGSKAVFEALTLGSMTGVEALTLGSMTGVEVLILETRRRLDDGLSEASVRYLSKAPLRDGNV